MTETHLILINMMPTSRRQAVPDAATAVYHTSPKEMQIYNYCSTIYMTASITEILSTLTTMICSQTLSKIITLHM